MSPNPLPYNQKCPVGKSLPFPLRRIHPVPTLAQRVPAPFIFLKTLEVLTLRQKGQGVVRTCLLIIRRQPDRNLMEFLGKIVRAPPVEGDAHVAEGKGMGRIALQAVFIGGNGLIIPLKLQ